MTRQGTGRVWNWELTYAYDYQNHLVEVVDCTGSEPTPHAQYDYDALGRRMAKRYW